MQIAATRPGDKPKLGSGYRVSERYVLTAAHVVSLADPNHIVAQSHIGGWSVGVIAVMDLGDDVALLELQPSQGDHPFVTVAPAVYAGLNQAPDVLDAVAIGYPRWARKERTADQAAAQPFWDLAQVHGRIAALNNWREGTFQFTIDTSRTQTGARATASEPPGALFGAESTPSRWSGMSGAALWVNQYLIGVITSDTTQQGVDGLTARRLDRVLARLDQSDPATAAKARTALGLDGVQQLADATVTPGYLLDALEAKQLQKILLGAPAGAPLRTIFVQATEHMLGLPDNADDLDAYIGALRQQVDARRLFRFLVRFSAATADPVTTRRLTDWIDRTAARYGVDPGELRTLREELRSTVLLVRLIPDMLGAGWQVTVWAFAGRDAHVIATSDEAWDREVLGEWLSRELPNLVDDFDEDDGTGQARVEFQVDDDEIDEDLEWVPITAFGGRYPLGAICPVVKRCRNRLSQPAWTGNWEAQWRRLKECGDHYRAEVIHWIQQAGPVQWDAGTHVAAALAYPWQRSDLAVILGAFMEAGTPIALWQRQSAATWGRRAALDAILGNAGLHKVPERVLAQRIRASQRPDDDKHAGRHLVLLWDDPEHVPDEVPQYQAPEYGGVSA